MRISTVFGPVRVARVLTVVTLAVAVPGSWLFGATVPTAAVAPWPETARWLREPGGPPDPATATPAQVAAFFASPAAAGLAARYPRVVGAALGAMALIVTGHTAAVNAGR
jgi:hypothetical protein